MLLSYDWPFLHVRNLQDNLIFSTLILGSVFSDYVVCYTGMYMYTSWRVLRCGVKCRVSERDDYVSRPLRRRSSATSAGGGAGGGCGRSAGSSKKLRRPRDVKQFRDEYGDLPPAADSQQRCTAARSLDDTINTTLAQLRLIQDGDCRVVRCFNTTANGLVNRGDSFRRKNDSTDALPGGHELVSLSRSHSSTISQASYAHLLAVTASADADDVDDVDDALPAGVQSSSSYTQVLVLGQPGVGRTALLQQFMTSQFMAAETTRGTYLLSIQLFTRAASHALRQRIDAARCDRCPM